VPEIITQPFWYTIKKVQDIDSYEFLLANKKCTVNVEAYRAILDICPRVKGVDFTDVPNDDTALTFLIDLEENVEFPELIGKTLLTRLIIGKKGDQDIPPKKSRGKGSKGKKTTEESQETINVSKESEPEPEPEPAKKNTSKSGGRSSKSVVIQDTVSTPKSKPATSRTKLKGAPSLTPQEQEAADIMQAFTESEKTSRRQQGIGGSNEGTSSKPGVLNESTIISTTSNEETGAKPEAPDEEKDITEEKDAKDGDADDGGNDTKDADDEDVKTESDEDEIYKYKIQVHKDEDVEMKDAKVEESDKGEEKVTYPAKEEGKKILKGKDDTKKTELPPSSSSLSVSSCIGDQFFKVSSDSSLVSTIKDYANTYVSSLLDICIQQETPQT
nr:hypothetical protein [Tanacetum cinerariifolium]